MVSLETPLPSSSAQRIEVPKVQVQSLAPGLSAVPTRQASSKIQDQHTQVVCQSFADRIVVLVTQVGKIGCLVNTGIEITSRPRG